MIILQGAAFAPSEISVDSHSHGDGDIAVFGGGQFLVEPVEHSRLPCGGQRHGILFVVVDIDCAAEDPLARVEACYRIRHYSVACQYIQGIACVGWRANVPTLFWEICSDIGSRCYVGRCGIAHNNADFGQ